MFQRIVVTCDLARSALAGLPDPTSNVWWLARGLEPACAELGIELVTLTGRDAGGSFDVASLYAEAGMEPEPESWCRLLSSPEWPRSVLESLLSSDLREGTLVVGFGLSPSFMRSLSMSNLPFIDLEIHPLRFGRDLSLRARTNRPEISARLERIERSQQEVTVDAAMHLAHLAVFGGGSRYGANSKIALFVGQSAIDAALVKDGALVRPANYVREIANVAEQHDWLFIRPHPYEASVDHLKPVLDATPNAVIVRDPTYALLAEQSVRTVIGLSSGVLTEARAFGKTAIALMQPDVALESLTDVIDSEIRVGAELFSASFWRLLSQGDESQVAVHQVPNLLRNSYGRAWGYEESLSAGQVPRLEPGEAVDQIDLGRLASMMLDGWNDVEATGVWASRSAAGLAIDYTEDVSVLRIEVADHISDWRLDAEYRVEALFRGGVPIEVRFAGQLDAEGRTIEVPVSGKPGPVVLVFRSSDTFAPKSRGFEPPDTRELGIFLKRVSAG